MQGRSRTRVRGAALSRARLHLLPKQTPAFLWAQNAKALFLGERTRAEAQFLGMADGVDELVPYVEFRAFMAGWDDTRGFYKLEPFSDFAPEVERCVKHKSLTKSDPIVIICRSGRPSVQAPDLLATLGYTRVCTVLTASRVECRPKAGTT